MDKERHNLIVHQLVAIHRNRVNHRKLGRIPIGGVSQQALVPTQLNGERDRSGLDIYQLYHNFVNAIKDIFASDSYRMWHFNVWIAVLVIHKS